MPTNKEAFDFKFGSEVYTWFMKDHGRANANRLEHMMEVIAAAGFQGIQPIHFWMGDLSDPERLKAALQRSGIELAAISLVLEWNGLVESGEERTEADSIIRMMSYFPGAVLCMVQKPTSRERIVERRKSLLRIMNAIACRASSSGTPCSFHPNSPESSITRTREDYDVLLNGLDSKVIGWTPDVGHIINVGIDPLSLMKEYAPLINHVHYKDWDGNPEFTLMGQGKVDLVGITRWLRDQRYKGWIICEDEGEAAIDDPDGVTRHDAQWLRTSLIPQL